MPTLIQYVGKRPSYSDSLYGTGDWTKGEIKPVHDVTATKMLKHADQYQKPIESEEEEKESASTTETGETASATSKTDAEATITTDGDVVGTPKPIESEEEKDSQDARDSVAHMDKDALLNYAQVHFRQVLDKRSSVENLRQKVVGMIDQFGLS